MNAVVSRAKQVTVFLVWESIQEPFKKSHPGDSRKSSSYIC